jgi:hypothetical protein
MSDNRTQRPDGSSPPRIATSLLVRSLTFRWLCAALDRPMRRASRPRALQRRVVMRAVAAMRSTTACPNQHAMTWTRAQAVGKRQRALKKTTRANTATSILSATLRSTQVGGPGQRRSLAVRWQASHGVLERYRCALVVTDRILSRSFPREDGCPGDARFPSGNVSNEDRGRVRDISGKPWRWIGCWSERPGVY